MTYYCAGECILHIQEFQLDEKLSRSIYRKMLGLLASISSLQHDMYEHIMLEEISLMIGLHARQ